MAGIDSKYITFKQEEFDNWVREMSEFDGALPAPEPITDGVVIRQQDIFGGVALHAYAGAVSNAIQVMEEIGTPVPPYLYDVRSYFHEVACGADEVKHKKLPD